jgi:prepilin-type N-terminal cleavage/methylation domain-containing protein
MTRSRYSTKRQPRRGFTLIELLVVISIIAVLVSLIAPAVQAARRTARKLECLNNMRQIGLAMAAFSSSAGNLPALTSDVPTGIGTNIIYGAGWPMALLPALDATAILKNVKLNAFGTGDSVVVRPTENIWIPVFTCPEDADSYRRPGGLSFVVNAGFIPSTIWGAGNVESYPSGTTAGLLHQPYGIDWNGAVYSTDGASATVYDAYDQKVETATGVFWRATASPASNSFQSSLDYLSTGDGTTSTLMISENLNAGPWNGSLASGTGWGVNYIGFGLRVPVTSGVPTTGVFVGSGAASTTPLQTIPAGLSDTTVITDEWVINRNLTATLGAAPRPSSQHAGGVNVIMGDSSGRFLNEAIDKNVYLKLLTSDGVTNGETTLNNRDY